MKSNILRRTGYVLSGIVGILLLLSFPNGGASTQTPITAGRYQLFGGEATISRQPLEKYSMILKIDTQTGETWGLDVTTGVWKSYNDRITDAGVKPKSNDR